MESTVDGVIPERAATMTPHTDVSELEVVQKLVGALLYSNAKARGDAGLPPTRDEAIKLAGDAICAMTEETARRAIDWLKSAPWGAFYGKSKTT